MSLSSDSATGEQQKRLKELKSRLASLMELKNEFVFILDDPTGNSYLQVGFSTLTQFAHVTHPRHLPQNLYAPDKDPMMEIEHYSRTYEQNEELGLNDMKTENYGEHEQLQADDQEPTETTPLQQAHLLEVGASAQTHLYTKDKAAQPQVDPNRLSPYHGITPGNMSRRVSGKTGTSCS